MGIEDLRKEFKEHIDLWSVVDKYFSSTLFFPPTDVAGKERPSSYRDFEEKIRKYISGLCLDIFAMRMNKLFSGLFPHYKEFKPYESELRDKLKRGSVDIIKFLLDKENEKFIEGFNKTVKPELRITEDNRLPEQFLKKLETLGIYASYDIEQETYKWDFSQLSEIHKYPTIYAAFRGYAHKWYTLLRIGSELSWFKSHKNVHPLLPSGEGESLPDFLMKHGVGNVHGGDFLYKHEKTEAIEEENRRKTILRKLKPYENINIPLCDLCYSVYIACVSCDEPDAIKLGEQFLEDILTRNKNSMDKSVTEYWTGYLDLIKDAPERVPEPRKYKKYIPTSLEKLLWQIAGQVPGLKKKYENTPKYKNTKGGVRTDPPLKEVDAEEDIKFLKKCYFSIRVVLHEDDRKEIDALLDKKIHPPLRKLSRALREILDNNKYRNAVRDILKKKEYYRLIEIDNGLNDDDSDLSDRNESHVADIDLNLIREQILTAFREQFNAERVGDKNSDKWKEFYQKIEEYVLSGSSRMANLSIETEVEKRRMAKSLFEFFCTITNIDKHDTKIRDLFMERIYCVFDKIK